MQGSRPESPRRTRLDGLTPVPIPEHKIDEVLERVDLVALVWRHVELKKSGRSFKGRCPFHQEKTRVVPRHPGDAPLQVLRLPGGRRRHRLRAALPGQDLRRRGARPRPRGGRGPGGRGRSRRQEERQQLKEVDRLRARALPQRSCGTRPRGERRASVPREPRASPRRRRAAFGLGWAPGGVEPTLGRPAAPAGMLEFGIKAGLVAAAHAGRRLLRHVPRPADHPHPRAGGADASRSAAGCWWADEGPKYLNSAEPSSTTRARPSTGMDQARDEIRRRKTAVLVEGYFDCIGLHQAGVKHAVALCSTALTPGHLSAARARGGARSSCCCSTATRRAARPSSGWRGPLLAAGRADAGGAAPRGRGPGHLRPARRGRRACQALLAAAAPLSEHLFRDGPPRGARRRASRRRWRPWSGFKPVAAQLPVGLVRSAFFSAPGRALRASGGGAGGRAARQGAPPSPGPQARSGGTPSGSAAPGPGRGGAGRAVPDAAQS